MGRWLQANLWNDEKTQLLVEHAARALGIRITGQGQEMGSWVARFSFEGAILTLV